jgi:hypothetical protein
MILSFDGFCSYERDYLLIPLGGFACKREQDRSYLLLEVACGRNDENFSKRLIRRIEETDLSVLSQKAREQFMIPHERVNDCGSHRLFTEKNFPGTAQPGLNVFLC